MTYQGTITELKPNQVFVFGSNTQGRHGAGSARWARLHAGARNGIASGPQGQAYAIVTKDLTQSFHPSVARRSIIFQIRMLYIHAFQRPEKEFLVAYSGTRTNLNGYTPAEMRQMFRDAEQGVKMPSNIVFEAVFADLAPPVLEKVK